MARKKKSKTSLQREIAKLKKDKLEALKQRKKLLARKKEMEELRALQREVRSLKGVGSKRRVAAKITKRIGSDAGRVGWKGLKIAGKFVKNVIEAEARAQARDSKKVRPKSKKKKR